MGVELEALLACPVDHRPLARTAAWLECAEGHRYPMVNGIPVLLRDDVAGTLGIEKHSLMRARDESTGDRRAPSLYLESLGLADTEREAIARLWKSGSAEIDPVVQYLVAATCGTAYAGILGRLQRYPIPAIPLESSSGALLIDIGCNWGRWSVAASRKGYRVVGLDPQLGAVMTARRVARQLGQDILYVCADARHLPFATGAVDVAFSYSVLQHFSRADCAAALREVGRALKGGGKSIIQMANVLGARSAYHVLQRGFRTPSGFEVRYYLPGELLALFEGAVGRSRLSADCFLGLGLQATDRELVSPVARVAIFVSEGLKKLGALVPPLQKLADSVYVESVKA